ncbi:MAG: single-stranded-DNA-specific exonuclease RecJ [Alphaproteobacteria bacterium]|nr:single-stranded-DNA-specific exonuclease RecJ [Alphaproteobacteria bacterium]
MDADDDRLSWTGSLWKLRPAEPERTARIARATGLGPVAARCLALRWSGEGVPDRSWLVPTVDALHDPALMHGMADALARLEQAIAKREKVRIITDYDVDGTTSSLILQAALRLRAPDLSIDYHIPSRFDEGYGFSVRAAEKAVEDGIGLIVTADIGVRDHAAVTAAVSGGTDVLICDHHLPAGADVPHDALVLCPPQAACHYPNPSLAACGVSLKLAQGLLRNHPKFRVILDSLLKLAAIGTVADLVPLTTPENRAIVALGLEQLNRGPHHAGLAALLRVCDMAGPIRESDLGFRLGPRINAAGRLQDARMVVELLNTRDPERANALASELDALNRERQSIQRQVFDEAMAKVDTEAPPAFVVVAGPEEEGWHRGVVGIVASKVKDAVYRPAAVVSIQGDTAVGSVRSIDGVHAVHALDAAADLLVKYGGHPAAAGFTVPTAQLGALQERLSAWVEANTAPADLVRQRRVDAEASPEDLTWDLYRDLEALGPFGMGNPRPRLLVRGVTAFAPSSKGDGKLLKLLVPRGGGGAVSALWWGEGARAESLVNRPVDLLGQLGTNTYRGDTTLQLEINDIRDA